MGSLRDKIKWKIALKRMKKKEKEQAEKIMQYVESAKEPTAVDTWEKCSEIPDILKPMNIDQLAVKYGVRTKLIKLLLDTSHTALVQFHCRSRLAGIVLNDLLEAKQVAEHYNKPELLEKFYLPYLVALHDICKEYKEYRDDIVCRVLRNVETILKASPEDYLPEDARRMIDRMGLTSAIKSVRAVKKLKKEADKDRKRLKNLYYEYKKYYDEWVKHHAR